MLPVCPYAISKAASNSNGRNPTESSAVLKNPKDSETGVDFRWQYRTEYSKLDRDKNQELYRWHNFKDESPSCQKLEHQIILTAQGTK